jgi:hypothetical protein
MDLSLWGQSRTAGERHRAAPSGLGPWDGARVASPRCPILRPGSFSVLRTTTAGQFTTEPYSREPRGRNPLGSAHQDKEVSSGRTPFDGLPRKSRMRLVQCLYYNPIVHLVKEDYPRLDRGNLRPPICPATFRTETFATREVSPTEVSRGMDRGDR